jgi:tetratricopeptide (TPR) repeat protein
MDGERAWWWRRRAAVYAALIVLGAVLPYLNGLEAPLTYDDVELLEENVDMRSLSSAWEGAWPRRFASLTFAANYSWTKTSLRGYHATNIAIHAAAGLCLLALAGRILSAPRCPEWTRGRALELAAAIAILWVVHPLQTESVTYVIQRFESLAGMLILLTLWLVARSWAATGRRAWVWLAAAMLAAWLAFQSKETAVVLPALVVAMDRCCFVGNWREVLRRQWVLYAFLAVGAAWTVAHAGVIATDESASAGLGIAALTPWRYLRSQPGVILHYLRLSFAPLELCIDYRWSVAESPFQIFGLGAVILALLAIAAVWLRRQPPLGFVAISFFILLGPTSSFVPILDLAVEHRMYLPLASVFGLVVVGAASVARTYASRIGASWPIAVASGGLLAVVLAFAVRTYHRNEDYAEPTRLWSQPLARNPANLRARTNLAAHLTKQGKYSEALEHLAALEPSMPNNAQLHNHFGIIHQKLGQPGEAMRRFHQAIGADPRFSPALFNLGSIHFQTGEWERAAEFFRAAIAGNARSEEAWGALGWALENSGDDREAVACFRRALELDPGLIVVPVRLADLLATSPFADVRDPPQALRLSESLAQRTRGRNRYVLDTLAAAYAANGRYADAIKTAKRALRFPGDPASDARIRARLEAYEAGRPAVRQAQGTNA